MILSLTPSGLLIVDGEATGRIPSSPPPLLPSPPFRRAECPRPPDLDLGGGGGRGGSADIRWSHPRRRSPVGPLPPSPAERGLLAAPFRGGVRADVWLPPVHHDGGRKLVSRADVWVLDV